MYDNYKLDEINYQFDKLRQENYNMYNKLCQMNDYINNTQEYFNSCDLNIFVEFFIKNPEKFNKITSKIRKEKIKNIEK